MVKWCMKVAKISVFLLPWSLNSYYRNCTGSLFLIGYCQRCTPCRTMSQKLSNEECVFNGTLQVIHNFSAYREKNPYLRWYSRPKGWSTNFCTDFSRFLRKNYAATSALTILSKKIFNWWLLALILTRLSTPEWKSFSRSRHHRGY